VPQGKIKIFNPSILHRIWIWFDLVIVAYFYIYLISLVEFLVCYTTCSWYFTRKKESAYVSLLSNQNSLSHGLSSRMPLSTTWELLPKYHSLRFS